MRNWSWQETLHGGDTPVCFSKGSHLKLGVGKKKWDVSLLFCFCWGCFFCPQPSCLDFSDDTPTSVILYSVIFNIVSRSVKQEFAHLYMCLRGVRNSHPCNIAFLKHLSPLTAQLLYSTQLYHFCRVEWKKGKAGIL